MVKQRNATTMAIVRRRRIDINNKKKQFTDNLRLAVQTRVFSPHCPGFRIDGE